MQTATSIGSSCHSVSNSKAGWSLQHRKVGNAVIWEHGLLLCSGSSGHRRNHAHPSHTHFRKLCQASSGSSGDSTFRQTGNASGSGDVSFNQHTTAGSHQQHSAASSKPNSQANSTQAVKLDRLAQLRQYGLAGVVAYGLLNTLYYSITFLFVWLVVAKVPSGKGAAAAAQSFFTVMATVWAGSQITKIARAAGALILAPIVDIGLEWLQATLRLENKNQAFIIILSTCISVAVAIFGTVIMAWA